MSRPKCPSCGTRNDAYRRDCGRCGALMAPVKPLSKPALLTLIAILLLYAVFYGLRTLKWN